MRKECKPLMKDIKNALKGLKNIKAAIVFGSVARSQNAKDSDIDICVVLERRNRSLEKRISELFLKLEKKYDRNIQLFICREQFKGVERQFLETILREGEVIVGSVPSISVQKLQLEPYAIIKYDIKHLSHPNKMKLARLLYGKRTEKRYKSKVYVSQKKGLLAALKGVRAGKSSILLPEKQSWLLEEQLKELGVKTKKVCAWLQRV